MWETLPCGTSAARGATTPRRAGGQQRRRRRQPPWRRPSCPDPRRVWTAGSGFPAVIQRGLRLGNSSGHTDCTPEKQELHPPPIFRFVVSCAFLGGWSCVGVGIGMGFRMAGHRGELSCRGTRDGIETRRPLRQLHGHFFVHALALDSKPCWKPRLLFPQFQFVRALLLGWWLIYGVLARFFRRVFGRVKWKTVRLCCRYVATLGVVRVDSSDPPQSQVLLSAGRPSLRSTQRGVRSFVRVSDAAFFFLHDCVVPRVRRNVIQQ